MSYGRIEWAYDIAALLIERVTFAFDGVLMVGSNDTDTGEIDDWLALGRSDKLYEIELVSSGLSDPESRVDFQVEFYATDGQQFVGEGRLAADWRRGHGMLQVTGTGPLIGIQPEDFLHIPPIVLMKR